MSNGLQFIFLSKEYQENANIELKEVKGIFFSFNSYHTSFIYDFNNKRMVTTNNLGTTFHHLSLFLHLSRWSLSVS